MQRRKGRDLEQDVNTPKGKRQNGRGRASRKNNQRGRAQFLKQEGKKKSQLERELAGEEKSSQAVNGREGKPDHQRGGLSELKD